MKRYLNTALVGVVCFVLGVAFQRYYDSRRAPQPTADKSTAPKPEIVALQQHRHDNADGGEGGDREDRGARAAAVEIGSGRARHEVADHCSRKKNHS